MYQSCAHHLEYFYHRVVDSIVNKTSNHLVNRKRILIVQLKMTRASARRVLAASAVVTLALNSNEAESIQLRPQCFHAHIWNVRQQLEQNTLEKRLSYISRDRFREVTPREEQPRLTHVRRPPVPQVAKRIVT